jgi:hypothetical protein
MLPAWIGTALGDHGEQAYAAKRPDAIIQSEVSIVLHGETRDYTLTGHPDVILPEGVVIDLKTSYGFEYVKRDGPDRQKQFQRHCYAKAAWEAGMFNDGVELSDVKVANLWLDRAGIERSAHVQMEPFNQDIVDEAAAWLDEVVYSYLHQEEARKEPPREMCAKACGFYRTCRAYDTDVSGLLTDQTVLTAVDMHLEAMDLERRAKRLKQQAKVGLAGVSGSTGTHLVRWTTINPSHVSFTRQGYDKLDIKEIPR